MPVTRCSRIPRAMPPEEPPVAVTGHDPAAPGPYRNASPEVRAARTVARRIPSADRGPGAKSPRPSVSRGRCRSCCSCTAATAPAIAAARTARPPATGLACRAGGRCRAIPATATSTRRARLAGLPRPSPSPRTASTARTACSRTAARPRAPSSCAITSRSGPNGPRHGGDPWGGRFQGRVDLDEVVLVGHSRGGEGVERATIDTYARRSLAGAGPRPDRADGLRPPGRARRAHDRHPAVLRRRRVGPAGPAVRGRRARPDARPRAAVLGHGDGHQPQLLQHRVDAGPVEVAGLGRLVRCRATRSAARAGAGASRPPNSRR